MYSTQPSPYLDENVMLKAPLLISVTNVLLDDFDDKANAIDDLQKLLNECQRADGLPMYDDGVPSDALKDENHPYWQSHDIDDIGQELISHLEEYLPPFCVITDQDGSLMVVADFNRAIEDMREQGQAFDDRANPVPIDHDGLALIVNDHGNVSLNFYRKDGQTFELWSVV